MGRKSPRGGPLKRHFGSTLSTSNFRQTRRVWTISFLFSFNFHLPICVHMGCAAAAAVETEPKKECRRRLLSFLLSVVTSWTQFPNRLFSYSPPHFIISGFTTHSSIFDSCPWWTWIALQSFKENKKKNERLSAALQIQNVNWGKKLYTCTIQSRTTTTSTTQ